MKPKFRFAEKALQKIKKENLYRQLRYSRVCGPHITIGKKKLLNLCSNDYLGLSARSPRHRQMQSSSRSVSGNDILFKDLEDKLASHKSQRGALVFPTGYMANLGAVSALAGNEDLILSDELNHASIIEACRLCRAKTLVYKHNDTDDLLKKIKSNSAKTKFVITEGIFSMDGDYARLDEIAEITEKCDAVLMIDDAHGDFAVGDDGKGTAHLFGVAKKVDVYTSSLSKALGSFGGYVASEKSAIDLCVNRARSFIYTSALPAFLADTSLRRLSLDRTPNQKKLQKNAFRLREGLKKSGYEVNTKTHIVPLIIGDEKKTLEFGRYLYENGVFAQPIRYPTVPKKSARIRISVTARLTDAQIESALDVFERAGRKFRAF